MYTPGQHGIENGVVWVAIFIIGAVASIALAYILLCVRSCGGNALCGRSFKEGTGNAKSISRTNMCSNCYGNFDSLKDFLD